MISCEEVCRLVASNDQCAIGASLVNTRALVSRLNLLLGMTAPSFGDAECRANRACRLVEDITTWAHERNAHRLCLVSGKQACLEGWRQVAEIGMRMLQFMSRVAPDTLAASGSNAGTVDTTSNLNGFLTTSRLASDNGVPTSNRYLFQSAMSLLFPLLQQVKNRRFLNLLMRIFCAVFQRILA